MPLIYHPDAEAELLDAVEFYSGRVPGLGDRFVREFDDAIATILQAPECVGVGEPGAEVAVMLRLLTTDQQALEGIIAMLAAERPCLLDLERVAASAD